MERLIWAGLRGAGCMTERMAAAPGSYPESPFMLPYGALQS